MLLLILAIGVLGGPAAAQAPAVGVFTGADVSRAGNVDLTVFAPDGSTAVYYERIGSRRVRLGERVVRGAKLPRRVPRGRAITVGIRDSWRIGGVKPRLCIAAPGARARCRVVALRSGQATRRYRFTPRRRGRWKLRLRLGSATGDSTMQGVDGFLADRLGGSARLISRVRPATGIRAARGS